MILVLILFLYFITVWLIVRLVVPHLGFRKEPIPETIPRELEAMLVKSRRFTEDDIHVKVVPLNLFIHQYLKVKVDGEWIDVDAWSHFLGIELGGKSAFVG